ncbi:hypothetical protein GCM10027053_51720 [Intrasporangium mesophilum]
MKNLVRSRKSNLVHHASCANAKDGVRWTWADGRPAAHVLRVIAIARLKPCYICRPFGREDLPPVMLTAVA